jgi:Fe-S-cluster containining protein
MNPKIGRNDPCPCGSGKKYKKCCGSTTHHHIEKKPRIDYFKLNREIAYKGEIGQKREVFCTQYIKHKKTIFKKATKEQLEYTKARGETITCHKGCSFCCAQHIPASLQECEAIVYYLYHNAVAFTAFLEAYPTWITAIGKNKDLFYKIGQLYNEMVASGFAKEKQQAFINEAALFNDLNIPCPFLIKEECTIYEVRPWVCASYFVTTPEEWCNPSNPNKPKVYLDLFEGDIELDFWDKRLQDLVHLPMQIGVYEILKGGFVYLSAIPGLQNLRYEIVKDPEIKPILKSYFSRSMSSPNYFPL